MNRIARHSVTLLAFFALLAFCRADAFAHALDPAYLEVRAVGAEAYATFFKVPQIRGQPMALKASLPENCVPRSAERLEPRGRAFVANWIAHCPGGLVGGQLSVDGLVLTGTDVLARLQFLDGRSRTFRLTAESSPVDVVGPPTLWDVVRTYFTLGVEHILLGIDHLLFILALMLLVRGTLLLVKTVTAFTVAHSITLTAATLGYVQLPSQPVEAVIALSIVFVAGELARRDPAHPSLAERFPWLIAFTFGLLHGFGFASALADIGLPERDIPAALLTFNLGVEVGQLLFIVAVLAGKRALESVTRGIGPRSAVRPTARMTIVYAIGVISAYWSIERIAGFSV